MRRVWRYMVLRYWQRRLEVAQARLTRAQARVRAALDRIAELPPC